MPQLQGFHVGDRVRTTYNIRNLPPGATGTVIAVFDLSDLCDVRFDGWTRARIERCDALELASPPEQRAAEA